MSADIRTYTKHAQVRGGATVWIKGWLQAVPVHAGVHSGRIVFHVGVAFANPAGLTVVNGTAHIHQQGNLLQITNSPNSIINWQHFSIGASEITHVLQQSASSVVLGSA